MNIAQIREALLWCVILNIGLVTVWSIVVFVAKGWLNGIILKWFRVSAEHCDMINLTGIVLYKVGNILFFLVPGRVRYSCLKEAAGEEAVMEIQCVLS